MIDSEDRIKLSSVFKQHRIIRQTELISELELFQKLLVRRWTLYLLYGSQLQKLFQGRCHSMNTKFWNRQAKIKVDLIVVFQGWIKLKSHETKIYAIGENQDLPGSKQMQDRMLPQKMDKKHVEEQFGTQQIFRPQEQHANVVGCTFASPGPYLQN